MFPARCQNEPCMKMLVAGVSHAAVVVIVVVVPVVGHGQSPFERRFIRHHFYTIGEIVSEEFLGGLLNLSEQILLAPNLIQRGFLVKPFYWSKKKKRNLTLRLEGLTIGAIMYWSISFSLDRAVNVFPAKFPLTNLRLALAPLFSNPP